MQVLNFLIFSNDFSSFSCEFRGNRMKHIKIVKKEIKAIERAIKLKEEKSNRVKEKHQLKVEQVRPRKQMIDQNEIKYEFELKL